MAHVLKKKNLKKKDKSESDFNLADKALITATSLVAFGGFMFCTIMIVLMMAIDY